MSWSLHFLANDTLRNQKKHILVRFLYNSVPDVGYYTMTAKTIPKFRLHCFIFVCTALVTTFNLEIGITGAILTKLDGDSRGGAALSVKEVCLSCL